jgi:hypothetical protein
MYPPTHLHIYTLTHTHTHTQAEAERERRGKIIAAEGELQASYSLLEAANTLSMDSTTYVCVCVCVCMRVCVHICSVQ